MKHQSKIIDIITKEELFPDKVPLDELRKTWNNKEEQYTERELEQIRNWLYAIAEIIVRVCARLKHQPKVIPINSENENQESNFICSGEYRRASRKRA